MFFGHRLVLCANSLYLNRALSKQRTSTSPPRPHYVYFDSNGEDPASIDYMLRFMYHGSATTLAREVRSSEAPRFWMGVYHIARKHEIASLDSYSGNRFAAALNQYLDEMEGVASVAHQTFHELVLDIYRMHQAFGMKANVPEYELQAILLQHTLLDGCVNLRGAHGKLETIIVQIIKEMPAFGSDLMLETLLRKEETMKKEQDEATAISADAMPMAE
jgi:hypothetical protein